MVNRIILIVEDDPLASRQLLKSIRRTDQQIHIRLFDSLDFLSSWIKDAIRVGGKSFATHGKLIEGDELTTLDSSQDLQLVAIVVNYHFVGERIYSLLARTKEFFVRKGISLKEDPTKFILTAFHDSGINFENFRTDIVANVFVKPFDQLILEQQFHYILNGHKAAREKLVAIYSGKSQIEILKKIQLVKVCPTGFFTLGDRVLLPGSFAKYYSDLFTGLRQNSVFARCVSSKSLGGQSILSEFRFFGIEPEQIGKMRRFILENRRKSLQVLVDRPTKNWQVLVAESRDDVFRLIEDILKRRFQVAQITRAKSWGEIQKIIVKDGLRFELSFVALDLVKDQKENELKKVYSGMGERHLICPRPLSDQEKVNFAESFRDVWTLPIERVYFMQKLYEDHPELGQNGDPLQNYELEVNLMIETARNVEASELSEAGLIMKYDRKIAIGEYRDFLLWEPLEKRAPRVAGVCHADLSQGADLKFYFVFFGLTPEVLKSVRLWMKRAYIASKQKG